SNAWLFGSYPFSPGLIIVRFGADLLGAMIDLARRRHKLLLSDLAERRHLLAELLLPRGGMCEGDEVPRPLVQFGERRPGFRLFDIIANLLKNFLQARLARDFTIDMGVMCHKPLLL